MRPLVLPLTLLLSLATGETAFTQDRRGRMREDTAPKLGQDAPDFELVRVILKDSKDGETTKADKDAARNGATGTSSTASETDAKKTKKPANVKLSSFEGKKPVVLAFGSFT